MLNRRADSPLLWDPTSHLIGPVKRKRREQELYYDHFEAETVGVFPCISLVEAVTKKEGKTENPCKCVMMLLL